MVHILKIFLKIVFLIVLPAFLSIFAQTEILTDILVDNKITGDNFDVKKFNDVCLALSILLNSIILGIDYLRISYIETKKTSRIDDLLLYCKEILTKTLSEIWEIDSNIGLNIRVFVPSKKLLFCLEKIPFWRNKFPLFYKIKNIETWAETGNTKRLKLRVNMEPQGLVGQCYATRNMIYDINLKNSNESNYKLSKNQIDQTRELTISICVPILDTNDKVIAIVAYDSTENLKISDDIIKSDKTKIPLITFARRMYEIAPEVFK